MISAAVHEGLGRLGYSIAEVHESEYRGVEADVAVFYGLWGNLRRIQQEYVAASAKSVLIDLGYWGRIWRGDKLAGHHRIAVNARHATAYFQNVRHSPERFRRLGIEPKPFRRNGDHVLLCGMSGKAAWVYGLGPQDWEREAIGRLRANTARAIRYRPKDSFKQATPLDGAAFHPERVDIAAHLAGAWAVVTHHGNAALDALVAGGPVFCEEGLASVLAKPQLEEIESPFYPDEGARDQLLYDAAWTQWRPAEMADGSAFRHLFEEGLI